MSQVLDIRLMVDTDDAIEMPLGGEEIARVLNHNPVGPRFRFLGGNVMKFRPPTRITIREHKYRGEEGFTVSTSRGESIFTHTRASAERIRSRLRSGEDIRHEDFTLT